MIRNIIRFIKNMFINKYFECEYLNSNHDDEAGLPGLRESDYD